MKRLFLKGECDMTKITNMILTAILRRGILYEARNVNMDFDVPIDSLCEGGGDKQKTMRINMKCDNMTLRIEKGRSEEGA
jgi:hypothetical protein